MKIEVAGCIIVRDGRLLVLWKRKRQHYELPGGTIEPGESPAQAAQREAKEEIGCDVILGKQLPALHMSFPDLGNFDILAHRFLAELAPGAEPRVVEQDVFDHLLWMPIAEYAKHKVAQNVHDICKEWLAEHPEKHAEKHRGA